MKFIDMKITFATLINASNSLSLEQRIVSTGVPPSLLQSCSLDWSLLKPFNLSQFHSKPPIPASSPTISTSQSCDTFAVAPTRVAGGANCHLASWRGCRRWALSMFSACELHLTQGHNSSSPLLLSCTLIQGFILQINSC